MADKAHSKRLTAAATAPLKETIAAVKGDISALAIASEFETLVDEAPAQGGILAILVEASKLLG